MNRGSRHRLYSAGAAPPANLYVQHMCGVTTYGACAIRSNTAHAPHITVFRPGATTPSFVPVCIYSYLGEATIKHRGEEKSTWHGKHENNNMFGLFEGNYQTSD